MTYSISVQRVVPRPLAAIRERMALRNVPSQFRLLLDQVYAAAQNGAIALDGQNVFVYHAGPSNTADVEFGVGTQRPFAPIGRVAYSEAPGGNAATTTHWGDYSALGAAHNAVVAWCKAERHTLAGISWEVYGHWNDDPAKRRTDIYYLLRRASE
ncbi:MAG: GyrI-like domain-containing protein [bacterium]